MSTVFNINSPPPFFTGSSDIHFITQFILSFFFNFYVQNGFNLKISNICIQTMDELNVISYFWTRSISKNEYLTILISRFLVPTI